jgi:hypothetical protein
MTADIPFVAPVRSAHRRVDRRVRRGHIRGGTSPRTAGRGEVRRRALYDYRARRPVLDRRRHARAPQWPERRFGRGGRRASPLDITGPGPTITGARWAPTCSTSACASAWSSGSAWARSGRRAAHTRPVPVAPRRRTGSCRGRVERSAGLLRAERRAQHVGRRERHRICRGFLRAGASLRGGPFAIASIAPWAHLGRHLGVGFRSTLIADAQEQRDALTPPRPTRTRGAYLQRLGPRGDVDDVGR